MEYSETEKQMLREILPGIATQLRGSLANIHAALGRLAPEQARDASADTDRSAAILCQSYYRILRVVNNLSDAPMLAEEKPLDTENVELVRFLDGLCRQGEALAQRTARRVIQAENQVFAAWPQEDVEQYLALTRRFQEALAQKAREIKEES